MNTKQKNSQYKSIQEQLEALKNHPIFTTACERPLKSDEVDVYLNVKSKIAAFDTVDVPKQRVVQPGRFEGRSASGQTLQRSSVFDLD